MTALRIALCSLVLLVATAPLMAQGTYTQFDVPGALLTEGFGVNTFGDIVGLYVDSSGNFNGFLLSAGSYTTIVYPGASVTYLFGINNFGKIVGLGGNAGFVYDESTATFTPISYPHANQTFPTAINDAGVIVGSVNYEFNHNLGFEFNGSVYRPIYPPATIYALASGISSGGNIVGSYAGYSSGNFLYSRGKYQILTIPNAPGAVVTATNPVGDAVVGYYTPSSGNTVGFVYQNKVLTALQFPGSATTFANGINGSGEVVGYFLDASGLHHGFTWTPSVDAPKP